MVGRVLEAVGPTATSRAVVHVEQAKEVQRLELAVDGDAGLLHPLGHLRGVCTGVVGHIPQHCKPQCQCASAGTRPRPPSGWQRRGLVVWF